MFLSDSLCILELLEQDVDLYAQSSAYSDASL